MSDRSPIIGSSEALVALTKALTRSDVPRQFFVDHPEVAQALDVARTSLLGHKPSVVRDISSDPVDWLAPEWLSKAVTDTTQQVTGLVRPGASELFADALWRRIKNEPEAHCAGCDGHDTDE